MNTLFKISALLLIVTSFAACSGSAKEKKADVNDKRAELVKLKETRSNLDEKIRSLEEQIAIADPASVKVEPKLVATTEVVPADFVHFIDLQGIITTENIYYVAPRGQGGQVKAINVKQGDRVKKGQLVVKLDDAIIRQQIDQAKIQLSFLQDLYRRRKNLWDQNIGTEVELISAKNNVTNAEKQIQLLNEQLAMTNVYSEVGGIAEEVNIRVGEILSPATASMAGIKIVNSSNLKASINIPENYLARVNKGTPVIVEVPDINKKFNSSISLVSQVINVSNRGFTAEAKVPNDPDIKPNQVALVRIQDYKKADAITVPLNVVQSDEKGKYVLLAVKEGSNTIAKKAPVVLGELYQERIEIKSGLNAGDKVITEGFQSIYEGQQITTDAK